MGSNVASPPPGPHRGIPPVRQVSSSSAPQGPNEPFGNRKIDQWQQAQDLADRLNALADQYDAAAKADADPQFAKAHRSMAATLRREAARYLGRLRGKAAGVAAGEPPVIPKALADWSRYRGLAAAALDTSSRATWQQLADKALSKAFPDGAQALTAAANKAITGRGDVHLEALTKRQRAAAVYRATADQMADPAVAAAYRALAAEIEAPDE